MRDHEVRFPSFPAARGRDGQTGSPLRAGSYTDHGAANGSVNSVPVLPGPFELKLSRLDRVTGDLVNKIRSIRTNARTFEPGMPLALEGADGGTAFIIDDGWTYASKLLTGGARQILNVQIPGDVAGLQNLAMPFFMQELTAMTKVKVREIRFSAISEISLRCPDIIRLFFCLMAADAAIAAERLMDVGRRTAHERVAHFILELATRLRLAGLEREAGFYCPMTQYHIADALGLTPFHISRVFRDLKAARLSHHHRGWISIFDAAKLADLAQFDGAYLTRSPV
jgi:CRP-like cAMP-binding protein